MFVFSITAVFILGLVLEAFSQVTFEDLYDYTKGYKIWVYMNSYRPAKESWGYRCIYHLKDSGNNNTYNFTEYYRKDYQRKKMKLYSKLMIGPTREPVMEVSAKPGKSGLPYTLKYWSYQDHCAIFRFYLDGQKACEMHVWDKYVYKKADLKCAQPRLWEFYCGRSAFTIYYDFCKWQ